MKAQPKPAKRKYNKDCPYDPKYIDLLLDYYRSWEQWYDLPVVEYFNTGQVKKEEMKRVANALPSMVEFCEKHDLPYQIVTNWKVNHEDWKDAQNLCMAIKKEAIINGGLLGMYSAPISCLLLTNSHGFKNTSHHSLSGKVSTGQAYDDMSDEELQDEIKKIDKEMKDMDGNKQSTASKKAPVKKRARKKTVRKKSK